MNKTSYTVKEIDDLRRVCETRWLFGTTKSEEGLNMSRSYSQLELSKGVEELVRTAMLAGHIAQDILDADKQ